MRGEGRRERGERIPVEDNLIGEGRWSEYLGNLDHSVSS